MDFDGFPSIFAGIRQNPAKSAKIQDFDDFCSILGSAWGARLALALGPSGAPLFTTFFVKMVAHFDQKSGEKRSPLKAAKNHVL